MKIRKIGCIKSGTIYIVIGKLQVIISRYIKWLFSKIILIKQTSDVSSGVFFYVLCDLTDISGFDIINQEVRND